ncbi:MAG TPA: HAD family phosphatase [Candidatus Merdibacter merdavium]|uniref:HAD family phosphatase n=1 Tax=Candidatus Merdibacter merdavium TaxID=2838692 RepID=A0A9D2NRY2_9FIRM|nr:HAD family phosphatase [Candidatus Merdibacter merdavium]
MNAIIFDMDGVLIDSERVYLERTLRFLKQAHLPFQMEDVLALAGGSAQHAEHFARKIIGPDADMGAFFARMNACCPSIDYQQIMFPHEREVLQTLAMTHPLAVASSSRMEKIVEVLRACQLQELFDFCLSGEMFSASKPAPDIYLAAAARLDLPPQECVVIEDSTYGIQAAKRAGMRVIARKDDRFGFDQSLADAFFHDYLELPALIHRMVP